MNIKILKNIIKKNIIVLKKIYYRIIFRYKKNIKIVVGASNTKFNGWSSTDKDILDITKEDDWKKLFGKKEIDNILAEHVIEHIEYNDFIRFLKMAKIYLKKGGIIRIAVPDKNHPSQYVKELTGKNGTESGADDHKYFYGVDDFEKISKLCDYSLDKIEYFDNNGIFHSNNLNFKNGYISRCSKNYNGRFKNNEEEYEKMINSTPSELRWQFNKDGLLYSSLLVDIINE